MTTGQANHPGIFVLESVPTAADGCYLTLADSSDAAEYPFVNLGAGGSWSYWEAQAIFQTDSSSVAHAQYLVGFSDNFSAYHATGGNQIAVRYDSTSGGCLSNDSNTNWVYEVIVSGTKTCYNTGLAVAPNTWYHARIYSSAQGTIQFQMNGAYPGTIAAAPTATLAPVFMNLSTSTGSQVGLSVDWWAMKMQGLVR
jgi:hypothetical protein